MGLLHSSLFTPRSHLIPKSQIVRAQLLTCSSCPFSWELRWLLGCCPIPLSQPQKDFTCHFLCEQQKVTSEAFNPAMAPQNPKSQQIPEPQLFSTCFSRSGSCKVLLEELWGVLTPFFFSQLRFLSTRFCPAFPQSTWNERFGTRVGDAPTTLSPSQKYWRTCVLSADGKCENHHFFAPFYSFF